VLAGAALFAGLTWLSGWAQGGPEVEKLRARAEQADVEAQNALGSAYNEGKSGLKQDYAEALKWFRRAAEKNFAPAQYNLAIAYELGHGVPADERQAFKYYLAAAEQGFGAAQYNVGNMYAVGRGIGQDLFESNLWLKQAAEKGIVEAQFNLGLAYEAGRGVKKDDAQAARWYKQAADRGFPRAQYNLGLLLEDGRGVAKNEAAAAGYYRAAADQGFAAAQNNYGVMISEGRGGLARDPVQAWVWLSLAVDNGANPAARDFAAKQLNAEQHAQADQLLADRRAGKAPATSVAAVPAAGPGPRAAELTAALEQARDANSQYAEANQRLELEKARLEQQVAQGGGSSSGLVDQLRAQNQRLAAQVETLSAEKESSQRELAVLNAQVKDLQQDSARPRPALVAPAPADVSRAESQVADLTKKLQQATASLTQLQATNQQLTEGNARLQQEKDALAKAAPTGGGEPSSIVANLQKDNARLNDEVKRSTRELLSLNSQMRSLRNQAAKATAPAGADPAAGDQVAQLNAKLEQATQDAVRAQAENTRLATRVTELEKQPKPATDNHAAAALGDAQKLTTQLQQQVTALQAEKSELEKWSRSLEQTLNEKSAQADGAGATTADLRQKVVALQKQFDEAAAENKRLAAHVAQAEQAPAAGAARKPDTRELDGLRGQVAAAQQQVEKLTRDNRTLADKAAEEHRSYVQAQARMANLERDLRTAQKPAANPAELDDLKGQLVASNQRLEQNAAAMADLTATNGRLESELAVARKDAAQASAFQLRNEQLATAAKEARTELEQAQARVTGLEKQVASAASGRTREGDDTRKLRADLAEANSTVEKLNATVAELTGANERLEKDLGTARQGSPDVDALRTELARLRDENSRMSASADEMAGLRAKIAELTRQGEELAGNSTSARQDLVTAQARVAELEKQLAATAIPSVRTRGGDEESRKLRTDLAEANSAVEKLNATVAELTGANDRLEKDLENARKSTDAALAAQSQAVSAARPDAYQMEIRTLQSRVKELEGQMEDDRNNSAKEVSTLAAQLARTRDTNRSLTEANRALMTAKQAEAPTVDKTEFDQLQVRVRDLGTSVANLSRQNDRLKTENEGLTSERAALQQQLEDAQKTATTAPALAGEKAALQERLEAVGAQLIKAQQDIDTLQKENADAVSRALASKTAADKAQADLVALQGRTSDAEKATDTQNSAVAELTGANAKLEEERTDLRRQLAAARADNNRLTQASGSLEQLKADADRSAQQNIAALSAQLAQVQRDLQSARETNSRIMEGNTAQERDRIAVINQLRNENTALAARLVQAQGTLDQIASAARLGTPAASIASGGTVPMRVPVSTPVGSADVRIHTVTDGDSLSRISMRYYGTANRWQDVYNANREVLQNSSTLRVGMQLRIP
jgi:TPR repeat protein/chromosome segregation ATPase